MSKGSISLLRTNPLLTTNVKLVVDSQYNLYLESYDTNAELSDKKFKKYLINYDAFLSQKIASFYKNTPTDIAFDVRNLTNSDNIQLDYNNQFDDIYYSGPRAVGDTRYSEEFQYNTTLKINPQYLPKYFFIFRIEGPGVNSIRNINDLVGNNIDNIKTEFVDKFKICSVVDLSPKTNIGKIWKKNYIDDDQIPVSPIEFVFKRFEFSKWKGYDYYTGGSVEKSFLMDDYVSNQTTHFEFEQFITEGFKKNGVICSNYSNISYLFDDTNAGVFYKTQGIATDLKYYETEYPIITDWIRQGLITDDQYVKVYDTLSNSSYYTFNEHVPYRKRWTINRYSGFYVDDVNFIDQLSPYVTTQFNLGQSISIVDNKFLDVSNNPISPVIGIWNENLPVYLKIDNKHYLIEKQGNDYLLISDTLINGVFDDIVANAQKPIQIVYENVNFNPALAIQVDPPLYRSVLTHIDDTYYYNINVTTAMEYSIVVIKIEDKFYSLKLGVKVFNNTRYYYLDTDEYIICNSERLYKKLSFNAAENISMQILNKDAKIPYFEIFVLKFTPVADFDFDRTNTRYSRIENDKSDQVSYHRNFIYLSDVSDISVPIDLYYERYYNIWLDSASLNTTAPSYSLLYTDTYLLPINSEYGTGDLYMLGDNNSLTPIWDVNQSIVKWGIFKSINNSSYPYKINNNLDTAGQFNFTPSIYQSIANAKGMNLDYFYSRGQIAENIINRTLLIDTDDIFDVAYYKDPTAILDYFDYYLNIPNKYSYSINNIASTRIVNEERISYFCASDKVNGPSVFFKGINAYIQYVDTDNPNKIKNYSFYPADDLENYGFSVIFNTRYTSDTNLYGQAGIEIILNKVYKNVLINIYVLTDGSFTSMEYRNRDDVYNDPNVSFYLGQFDSTYSPIAQNLSELTIQNLTLKSITNILDNTYLSYPGFSQGITYTVVQPTREYTLSLINPVYDGTYTIVKFTIDEDFDIKEGDWVYITNTGLSTIDNKNYQVIDKLNNRTFSIRLTGDYVTTPLSINTIIKNEISLLPFRLKIIYPDEIKLNTQVNLVVGDTSCPVTPFNKFANDLNIAVNINDALGIIPYVYVDDIISRKLKLLQDREAVTYSEIDKLPSIYRYSGNYEPILNNITLFKQTTLVNYNYNFAFSILIPSYSFLVETTLVDGYYYVSIHFKEFVNVLLNNLKLGDVFQVGTSNLPGFKFISGHVTAIEPSTYIPIVSPGDTGYKVTFSTKNVVDPIAALGFTPNPLIPSTVVDYIYNGYNVFVTKLYTKTDKNVEFAYDYLDFGTNKNLIISKVYEGSNPLKTSNEIYKTTNKYSMIDEHGVSEVNRNLFKSSWDPEFYYKTTTNKYKLKV